MRSFINKEMFECVQCLKLSPEHHLRLRVIFCVCVNLHMTERHPCALSGQS